MSQFFASGVFYILATHKWMLLVPDMEKAMATHSSTLAWKIPWTEEPGGLQSMGWQRVGHDWATSLSLLAAAAAVPDDWVGHRNTGVNCHTVFWGYSSHNSKAFIIQTEAWSGAKGTRTCSNTPLSFFFPFCCIKLNHQKMSSFKHWLSTPKEMPKLENKGMPFPFMGAGQKKRTVEESFRFFFSFANPKFIVCILNVFYTSL